MVRWWALGAVPLLVLATACGGGGQAEPDPSSTAAATCRGQWKDLGESVQGLDEDPNPSALAGRWTTILAAIDYYATSAGPDDCPARLEDQQRAIDDARQLSEKLRPYDMSYQLEQLKAGIDLYLHDPLPAPAKSADGRTVRPPAKTAVLDAYRTLEATAADADAELEPAWQQVEATPLTDAAQLREAVQGLDATARASAAWRNCERALQVLVAAIRAQEGLLGEAAPLDP